MAFKGKTVLVTGASGTVGAGILQQFLRAEATVIAPVRGGGGKASLPQSLGLADDRLQIVEANVSEEHSVLELARYVKDTVGHLDHVVTAVGGWQEAGPLLQQSLEDFLRAYNTYVVSHFLLAKHLLPLVKPAKESSFSFVTGSAGEGVLRLDASLITAHVAGLYGVIMCIQKEYEGKATRINELRIGAVIRRHEEATNLALPDQIRTLTGEFSNRAVGKAAVELALDASSSRRFVKLGPQELQQLEAQL